MLYGLKCHHSSYRIGGDHRLSCSFDAMLAFVPPPRSVQYRSCSVWLPPMHVKVHPWPQAPGDLKPLAISQGPNAVSDLTAQYVSSMLEHLLSLGRS